MRPGTLKFYLYQRPGLKFEVYRDRIVVREVVGLMPRTLVVPLTEVTGVRCAGGRLIMEFNGDGDLAYELGPAAAEVRAGGGATILRHAALVSGPPPCRCSTARSFGIAARASPSRCTRTGSWLSIGLPRDETNGIRVR